MNLAKIIITGRVIEFGEKYLNILNDEMSNAYKSAEIKYSSLGKNAIVIGAIYKAVNDLFSEKSEICQPMMVVER